MPTDEGDQDGHFFLTTPRGEATPLPRRAQPLLLLFRSNPPTEGGGESNNPFDKRAAARSHRGGLIPDMAILRFYLPSSDSLPVTRTYNLKMIGYSEKY